MPPEGSDRSCLRLTRCLGHRSYGGLFRRFVLVLKLANHHLHVCDGLEKEVNRNQLSGSVGVGVGRLAASIRRFSYQFEAATNFVRELASSKVPALTRSSNWESSLALSTRNWRRNRVSTWLTA